MERTLRTAMSLRVLIIDVTTTAPALGEYQPPDLQPILRDSKFFKQQNQQHCHLGDGRKGLEHPSFCTHYLVDAHVW